MSPTTALDEELAMIDQQHERDKLHALRVFVLFFCDDGSLLPAESCDLDYLVRQVQRVLLRHHKLFRDIKLLHRGKVSQDQLQSLCAQHKLFSGTKALSASLEQKLEALFGASTLCTDDGRLNFRAFANEMHRLSLQVWQAELQKRRTNTNTVALATVDDDGMRWISPDALPGVLSTMPRHNLGETLLLSESQAQEGDDDLTQSPLPARDGRGPSVASPPASSARTSLSRQMLVDTTSPSGRRWQYVVSKLSEYAASASVGRLLGAIIRSIYQDGPSSIEWASVSHRCRAAREEIPPTVSRLSRMLLKNHQRGRSIMIIRSPPNVEAGSIHLLSMKTMRHAGCPATPFVLCFGFRGPFDVLHFGSASPPDTEAIQYLVSVAREVCQSMQLTNSTTSTTHASAGSVQDCSSESFATGNIRTGARQKDTDMRILAYIGGDCNGLGRTGPIELDLGSYDVHLSDSSTRKLMESTTTSVFTAYPPPRGSLTARDESYSLRHNKTNSNDKSWQRRADTSRLDTIKRLQMVVDYAPLRHTSQRFTRRNAAVVEL